MVLLLIFMWGMVVSLVTISVCNFSDYTVFPIGLFTSVVATYLTIICTVLEFKLIKENWLNSYPPFLNPASEGSFFFADYS